MQMRMPRLFVIFAGLVIAIAFAVAGPADAAGRVSSGTGFFVSKRGYLITNFHVVESCRQVGVQVGRAIDTARVVALDPANDLALLATRLKPLQVADLRVAAPEGETTISYGFPLGTDRTTIGTVLGLTGWHEGKLLYLQSGNEPGMSGSAVIDRTGNVIGVNVGVLGLRIAKATGSAAVTALLDAHGVGHAESDPAQQRPLAEVIERAKKITAKVLCRSDSGPTDAQICRRAGAATPSDATIISACNRAIAAGTIGGETLRSMYAQRAIFYTKSHQYDLAFRDCDAAAQIASGDSDNFRCRAQIYLSMGDYGSAIEQLDAALTTFHGDTLAWLMRAGAHLASGNLTQGLADLDQAIAIDPDFTDAIMLRGAIFQATRRHARAVADFDRAISIYDQWIKLYLLPATHAELLAQRRHAQAVRRDREPAFADDDETVRLSH